MLLLVRQNSTAQSTTEEALLANSFFRVSSWMSLSLQLSSVQRSPAALARKGQNKQGKQGPRKVRHNETTSHAENCFVPTHSLQQSTFLAHWAWMPSFFLSLLLVPVSIYLVISFVLYSFRPLFTLFRSSFLSLSLSPVTPGVRCHKSNFAVESVGLALACGTSPD